jgi:hypothetical protein
MASPSAADHTAPAPPPASWITYWAVASVLLVLGQAVFRLGRIALDAFTHYQLSAVQWAVALAWLAFMLHSEGYRGFHQAFSPRVVARALHLGRRPRAWLVLLAPLYCMSLVHASRKRQITSWIVLSMIVGLVIGVRQMPQPYRGIIDLGVIAGLAFGMGSVIYHLVRGVRGLAPPVPADLPPGEEAGLSGQVP